MSRLVPARLYAEASNAPPPCEFDSDDDLFTLGRDHLEWRLRLGEIFTQTCRSGGRATVVAKATVLASPGETHNGADVVVKWLWAPRTRKAEADFVRRARTLAEKENTNMLDRLPNFLHVEEEVEIDEDVVLRVIVQELLTPLDNPTLTADELAKAFKDVFECYRWLVEAARILHRDISVKNLMYRRKDDQIYGVLNDFDLAHFMDDESGPVPAGQRVGTVPYMARDLLLSNPYPHLPRHDLESLVYVLIFLVCDRDDPGELVPLRQWKDLDMRKERLYKYGLLFSGYPGLRPGFNRFDLWIYQLTRIFRAARGVRVPEQEPEPVDQETLGGRVTFDTFALALSDEPTFF
ncbi:kinase-like domain-containing protein [Roridomyces roridus]|uniref:Kinase-like domain-containing protein n=1 Tax=Roridomyces roridus TaxID=1738132 RepID=A0AAD7CI00_9AGAR|nr:kinase-like domain-containing protein [Roridomyces roridus]